MYQMKTFIDMEQSPLSICLLLSSWFLFSCTANEYYIYHFRVTLKDLSISFPRVMIVQDFKTVTFDVLFVCKPAFSVVFCWMKRVSVSSHFNSLFIIYISTAKPFSLVRGFVKMKINKYEIW